jgi:hypothetical protein
MTDFLKNVVELMLGSINCKLKTANHQLLYFPFNFYRNLFPFNLAPSLFLPHLKDQHLL